MIFAWWYYGAAVFILSLAPLSVYNDTGDELKAMGTYFIVLIAVLEYYPIIKDWVNG